MPSSSAATLRLPFACFNDLLFENLSATVGLRLDYEVYILESTDNVDYLLVQYDTVNWAREHGILVENISFAVG